MFLDNLLGYRPSVEGALGPVELTPEQQEAIRRQGVQALGAQLLAASGPSREKVGFGQAFAQGVMAKNQATAQAEQRVLLAAQYKQQQQERLAAQQRQKAVQEALARGDIAGAAMYDPQAANAYRQATAVAAGKPLVLGPNQVAYNPDGSVLARGAGPEQKPGYRTLSPEEVRANGLGPGVWQVGPDNKITQAYKPEAAGGSAAQQDRLNKLAMMESSLNSYEGKLKAGPALVPGTVRYNSLAQAHKDLQLQAKELYQLGVLAGPDMDLLDAIILDPTSLTANFNPEVLAENTAEIRKILERAKAAMNNEVVAGTNNLLAPDAKLPSGAGGLSAAGQAAYLKYRPR